MVERIKRRVTTVRHRFTEEEVAQILLKYMVNIPDKNLIIQPKVHFEISQDMVEYVEVLWGVIDDA